MYKDLPGEDLQEKVTIGYGMEMEKRGINKGIGIGKAEGISIGKAEGCRITENKYKKALDGMFASSSISEEEKQKMRETFRKLSSD